MQSTIKSLSLVAVLAAAVVGTACSKRDEAPAATPPADTSTPSTTTTPPVTPTPAPAPDAGASPAMPSDPAASDVAPAASAASM